MKLKYDKKAKMQYDTNYIKKLKWFSYINKCKHEDTLIKIIKNEFGNDIKIIIGDWSNYGTTKYISTPNIGLKRKLAKNFKVYFIDEYLTSKIHYKHDIKCTNIYVSKEGENIKKKLHSVLSYKKDIRSGCINSANFTKSIKSGCINRDKNAVLNMERLVDHLINTGERLSIFSRSNNQTYLKTDINNSVLKDNISEANLLEKSKR